MKHIITKIQFLIVSCSTLMLLGQDFKSLTYRSVGPERGGRVTTVTGTTAEPGTFYLGASGGGVWKTKDYGTTWKNISDGYFKTPSIGAIEVASNDPNIIYVGTGSDGLRSNVISGKGMYKSIDAGKTWEQIGLKEVGQIGAVEIDPTNHNIVWVAAIGNAFKANSERGIYKTMDGGKSWNKVLYVSEVVGFSDLELLPGNPNVIYAAAWKAERKPWTIISGGLNKEGGLYKSINGGKDWIKLKEGLPNGLIGKIDLAVSEVDSSILYAVIEAPNKQGGLYKSINQGKSFKQISDNKGLVNRPFYYTNIELDPTNSDIIYSNANPLLKSIDGGKSFKQMSVPHGDNHDIWINPNNPNLLIQANDGGANVSHNGGKTWSSQFNQPTAELYTLEIDDQYPYWLYSGQQDNSSTIAVPSYPPSSIQKAGIGWVINTGGCETGPAVPKPGNHNIVYANCKGRFGVFNKLTGIEKGYYVGASNIYGHNPKDLKYRFQRVAPIHVSPHDSNVIYHGSQYVHKTETDGRAWETISPDLTAFEEDKQVNSGSPITRDITGEEYYSTLYTIKESTIQKGLIWTGSNDGVISLTRDGGKTWNNVTPTSLPKGGRVESIEPSKYNSAKAYIAVERHLLGDSKPYLYKTTDFGKSWEFISKAENGIPNDHFTRVLREDPVREGLLYTGTEYGVFISFDDGGSWKKFQQNLPITPITDLKIFRGDLILSTMGRGFWILDNITSLRQNDINNLNKKPHLFQPDNTIRYRFPNVRSSFPKYPRTSVIMDYFIPKGTKEGIQLDVYNSKNELITTVVSDTTMLSSNVEEVEDMNLSQIFRYVDNKLTSKPGFHRFTWNLRRKGAWAKNIKRRFKNGPLVPPGTYTARLTMSDQMVEQSFEIIIDPRVLDEGITKEDLKKQLQFQNKVIALLSKVRLFESKLSKEQDKLKGKKSKNKVAKFNDIQLILKQLNNDKGAYPQQMLLSQISYLYNMVSRADQLPGKDATDRLLELENQWKRIFLSYTK